MYIGVMAEKYPERAAFIVGEFGPTVTYAELNARSNQIAHALAGLGIGPGDGVAVVLPNIAEFGEIWWAAMRSGLYFTPVNWHLTASEIRFVVEDCGAKALFFHDDFAETAMEATEGLDLHRIRVGGRPGVAADVIGLDEFTVEAGRKPGSSTSTRVPRCSTRREPPESRRGSARG